MSDDFESLKWFNNLPNYQGYKYCNCGKNFEGDKAKWIGIHFNCHQNMSENKFTKGEWRKAVYTVWDSEDKIIANTSTIRPKEECQANAQLISAAPDLLEACEIVIKQLDSLRTSGVFTKANQPSQITHAKDVCKIAIAKAKGE